MCLVFEGMINKAEDTHGVVITAFCCDSDGGSQRGRKNLVLKRPWLLRVSVNWKEHCSERHQRMAADPDMLTNLLNFSTRDRFLPKSNKKL